jgi:hypothetical protein
MIHRVALSEIDTALVSDTHSTGQSYHSTMGTGSYYKRNYIGFSNFNSKTMGTVTMMSNGVPRIVWNNISDPHVLARLINYEIKQQRNVTTGMNWLRKGANL